MAVDPVVQVFIARSMAENSKSLMSEISTSITNSVESIKRSNSEAVDDELREIKKIRREEPKSFKRKAELIEGNGYEGRQTSKGELFVKVFGMSRDFEGAHIDFKMAASV